jgi:Carboxypeptidase regulatory-like domain
MFVFAPRPSGTRAWGAAVALVIVLAIVVGFPQRAAAAAPTTGEISGTVTDARTHAPIAKIRVAAAAPSGHYAAITDAKGFFAMTGVTIETYTISFERAGYESQFVHVNVAINQTQTVKVALVPALREIGRVSARGSGGAFQPHAAVDSYNLTASQILIALGKAHNPDETALLRQVPGESLDANGYPVIRGGRQNEQAYQVEGINYLCRALYESVRQQPRAQR